MDDMKDPVYSTWRCLREQANGEKESQLKENTTMIEDIHYNGRINTQ